MLVGRALVLTMLVVAACDPKANDEDDGHGHESGDADSDSDSSDQSCAMETRDDTYVLGLEKSGEHVTVRFVDATPAPPARFDNTWVIEVVDAATGTPLDDIDLVVEPFMPDHMHGTSIACEVTVMDAPGELQLAPVNLFMPGLWEVRLNFTLDEGATDQVVFRFCVDP